MSEVPISPLDLTGHMRIEKPPPAQDETDRNADYRRVAREMESLFAYQLLRIMRKSSEAIGGSGGLGKDTYSSLFDLEISRLLADRGLGLQESIIQWLSANDSERNYTLPDRYSIEEND